MVKAPEGTGETAKEPYFDYTATPPAFPEGWPSYVPNDRGLSKAVFMNLKDYMRPVARGVIVGRAFKKGAPEGSYFVLARAL